VAQQRQFGGGIIVYQPFDSHPEDLPIEHRLESALLGGYLTGRGFPPDQIAEWMEILLWYETPNLEIDLEPTGAPHPETRPMGDAQTGAPEVIPAETPGGPDPLRTLIETAIDDEATAANFYREIARALDSVRQRRAAEWVRRAVQDEQKHAELLQEFHQTRYGTTHTPRPRQKSVRNIRQALTEALGDEFEDVEKYRNAYVGATDEYLRQLFFLLMTDEMRHADVFLYALQALRQ
jgi:rubrerythrin